MKRIHYKQIFDKLPNIEKQFAPLLKTMNTITKKTKMARHNFLLKF